MGWRVILTARRETELRRVAAEISASGGSSFVVPADLADRRQLKMLVDRVFEEFEPIDILVNNAGRVDLQYIHELDINRWDMVMELNLRVPAFLTASVLPSMRRRGSGYIINVSSESGIFLYEGMGAYAVSKHALCGLTELIQNENQEFGIKAWAICPGDVSVERTRLLVTEEEASKFLEVQDVLGLIRLLLTQRTNVKMGPRILIRPTMNPYA